MATMAAPHQPRYDLEDPGFPRNAREAREAARAARNGSSPRYRRTQSPEQVDDYRFAGEDDMRSPTSDVALQDAMLAQAQQQQQRVVPVGQNGRSGGQRRQPPGPNNMNGPPGRGGPHPSYSGGMENGPEQHGPREGGRYRRQSRRPSDGGQSRSGPSDSPPGQAPNTQQNRSQAMASEHHQQSRRGPSPERLAVPSDINRLNSPSIQKIVLQPLEQKIQEYDHLMNEAQSQMAQLDDELRILQERRRQAEDRFMEAKAKHDEYERQHLDVGKALRGELVREQVPPPVRPMARMESVESFGPRPVSEQSSFHQKPKGRGMLRMSLFNKSS
ncbi:hypothetical protein NW767_014516 [Fusarium falciforme]|nr:hypothetical protein NW767_014516 [Fusarium falciforme]KAJ4243604.1 hypothetical protein NW757_011030 [Fusarium falciforme]